MGWFVAGSRIESVVLKKIRSSKRMLSKLDVQQRFRSSEWYIRCLHRGAETNDKKIDDSKRQKRPRSYKYSKHISEPNVRHLKRDILHVKRLCSLYILSQRTCYK